jgi:hypothetical protein
LYKEPVSLVQTAVGLTDPFPVDIGLHQGSALSPLLFIITMEEVTRGIRQGLPWEILFADDLVLMADTEDELRTKLLLWKETLEHCAMKVNTEKTKVMECNRKIRAQINTTNGVKWPCAICSNGVGANSIQCTRCQMWVHRKCSGVVRPLSKLSGPFVCAKCTGQIQTATANDSGFQLNNGLTLEKVVAFSYLGDTVQANGGAQQAVRARIKTAWMKWREISPLLVRKDITLKIRALAYKIYIRSALLYGSETWALTKKDTSALDRTELRMLRKLTVDWSGLGM